MLAKNLFLSRQNSSLSLPYKIEKIIKRSTRVS